MFYLFFHLSCVFLCSIECYNISFVVYDKFSEIPWNFGRGAFTSTKQLTISPKKTIDFMRKWAINFSLLKNWKRDIIILENPLFCLLVG